MRETIGAVVRKPVFRIKLIAISLLFVVSLIEQVSNNYIQSSGQQVGRMTVNDGYFIVNAYIQLFFILSFSLFCWIYIIDSGYC